MDDTRRWMYRLRDLHLNDCYSAYVEQHDDGDVTCLLCGTGRMNPTSRKSHFNGFRHLFNYYEVKEAAEIAANCYSKLEWFQQFNDRINSLGSSRWRQDVQSLMFKSFFPPDSNGMVFHLPEDNKTQFLQKLDKYERMEMTSLLELALWKASIISDGLFSSIQQMREYPILDEGFNPKEFAMVKRVTCGSSVVIPLVLTFL